jgi:Cu+-exporting ATPase
VPVMRDAVCKMELDERHVKESLVYEGRSYYFCSVGCRAEFERHPKDYAQAAQSEDGVKNDV